MKNYKLAWRNLWRNRRRTLITAASIFFAVFFALIMRSIQIGSYDYMYKNVIESYSGYIQVQQKDWWDEKTLDNSFAYSKGLEESFLSNENVNAIVPRLESFALASNGPNTKGVMVMGIDPEKEAHLSDIKIKLAKYHLSSNVLEKMKVSTLFEEGAKELAALFEGTYYKSLERLFLDLDIPDDGNEKYFEFFNKEAAFEHENIEVGVNGVWLGSKLADYLELTTGDTIVMLGQGYHGVTAAGKYPIRGLVKLPLADISSRVVYMPYDIAQELYGTGDNITSIVLSLNKNEDKMISKTIESLNKNLKDEFRIIDWREMNEIIIQQMEADDAGGVAMLFILYVVIGFGIYGTVLMMASERKREFGVLVAIGMQKKKLSAIMSWEMIYIGLLGIGAGMIICIPLILYGSGNPIILKGEVAHAMEQYDFEARLAFEPIRTYVLAQVLVVGIMVSISLIHPLRKISKMKVVNALRA